MKCFINTERFQRYNFVLKPNICIIGVPLVLIMIVAMMLYNLPHYLRVA